MRKWILIGIAAILVIAMWRCGFALAKGRKLSNAAVLQFHQNLNAEKYVEICADADQRFIAQNRDELIRILRAVRTKLGTAGDATLADIRVMSDPRGTFTITSYNTTFEKGSATEKFTFLNTSGNLKLYGYHIDSNVLITN